MKLSKIDLRIVKKIMDCKSGVACYQIARELSIDVAYIHRRLKIMLRHNILTSINSKPVFYKIDLRNQRELINMIVECPKCKTRHIMHIKQNTKVCDNPDCLTKKGVRTRFNVYDKRIISYNKII